MRATIRRRTKARGWGWQDINTTVKLDHPQHPPKGVHHRQGTATFTRTPLLGRRPRPLDPRRGDTLLTPTGDHTTITHAHTYPHHHRVHNLTINTIHTYYVLADETPVLVHNCGGGVTGAPRSADGKFSKRNGEPGRDGAADEANAWDQLEMDGAAVMRNGTAVSAPGMRARKYDGTVEINGQWYGLEVKGGTAKKNPHQRQFDD